MKSPMLGPVLLLVGVLLLFSALLGYRRAARHDLDRKIDLALRAVAEKAYFDGQREAITGDVRICYVSNNFTHEVHWEWIKSPWDDSTNAPIFNPAFHKTVDEAVLPLLK